MVTQKQKKMETKQYAANSSKAMQRASRDSQMGLTWLG
jgi:hypothetical protein